MPSVTFNDPAYSLNAIVKKSKLPSNQVAALMEAEEKAKAEITGDDDDDEQKHDEFNEVIFKSTGMPNHTPDAVL